MQLQSQVSSLKKQLASNQSNSQAIQNQSRSRKLARSKVIETTAAPPARPKVKGNEGLYLIGVPVFSSPYIGEHSSYDGSDLIVNQSDVNFDVRLLRQQQVLEEELHKKGLSFPEHSFVQLSGNVEGLGNAVNTQPGNTKADINLSEAQLDLDARINPWVLAFMDFSWDDSFPGVYRVANSNVIIEKAFITLGNFAVSPFYASLGQVFVPFRQYHTYMVSDPLPELMAKTNARTLVIGSRPQDGNGIFTAGYIFRSDTRENAKSADGGVNLGYEFSNNDITADIAVGAIANIADSEGMQDNAAPIDIPFGGFGSSREAEMIFKSVPAIDVHGSITIHKYQLIAEYIDSTTAFDPRALTFNGSGARVSAANFEAGYNFTWHDHPGSFAIGYGFTEDALALLLPHERYIATLNYSFWRRTLASLEFRHDVNYSSHDQASGAESDLFNPLNKYVNMVTAQFAVFF